MPSRESKDIREQLRIYVLALYSKEEFKPFVALIGIILVSSILSPYYLTIYNWRTILAQASPYIILAIGETLIILMGSIDLSPGSVLALSGAVTASCIMLLGLPVWLSVLIGLAIGGILGLINGIMVTKAKIPSFVATLAMLAAARGLTLIITGGRPISGLPDEFTRLAGFVYNIPVPFLITLIVLFFTTFLLKYTKIGRYVYAIGGNEEAARFSGINVDAVKIVIFTLSGILYGLAGIIIAARLASAYPQAGVGYELDAIASSVLGGVQLIGGLGSPIGALIGTLILITITNILILLNVNPYYQFVVKGFVLALAATTLTRGLRYTK